MISQTYYKFRTQRYSHIVIFFLGPPNSTLECSLLKNYFLPVEFPHLFAPAMGDSNHPLLVAARDIQRYSPDLVIYSRLVGAVVSVSWYVFILKYSQAFSEC